MCLLDRLNTTINNIKKILLDFTQRYVIPWQYKNIKAFVSKNILMPEFHVLCLHFSNHYIMYHALLLPALFSHGKVFCIFLVPQEQNFELLVVILSIAIWK